MLVASVTNLPIDPLPSITELTALEATLTVFTVPFSLIFEISSVRFNVSIVAPLFIVTTSSVLTFTLLYPVPERVTPHSILTICAVLPFLSVTVEFVPGLNTSM